MLFAFVLGDILGGGIYALVGQVGDRVGGAIWTAFAAALILAAFTAASYAELITKYPSAGGAGLFAKRAFGKPVVSFLIAFAVAASGITSAATLARAFGGDYLHEFVDVQVLVGATALLVAAGAINLIGISQSVRVNLAFTAVEVAGLLLIAVIGAAVLLDGGGDPSRAMHFAPKHGSVIGAILAGTALSFYALIGFEDSANVAEEVRDPRRAYPRALFGGLAAAGAIYIAVSVIASMVVPTGQLASSSGPLLEVNQGPLAVNGKVFAAIGLVALSNGALINLIMASRLLYGMAREKVMPAPLATVYERRGTPVVSIVFVTALALALAASGDLGTLASTTVVLLLGVFIVVNVCVLVLRADPVEDDHFRVPAAIPVLGALTSAVIMTQPAPETYLRAGALMALGVVLWALTRLAAGRAAPPAG